MAIQRRNKVEVSFSMSSMTDIVFLLLIFFIIASTLITPNALNIILPKATPENHKTKPVTIEISKDGIYALDGNNINIDQLENKVKNTLNDKKEKGIILKADKDVPFNYVVNVMDIANRNKFEMVVATEPK